LREEHYADWPAEWREALVDRHRELLAAFADAHAAAGISSPPWGAARQLLAGDPLDEGAHRRIMRAYTALGRPRPRARAIPPTAGAR
jgi:DNA-binding SARP family transcriptional activator